MRFDCDENCNKGFHELEGTISIVSLFWPKVSAIELA